MASKEKSALNRVAARAFVKEVNARTVCAHCGAQPVEWHNPDHVALNRRDYRIGRMVGIGRSIEKIQAEMSACTPLCRRCHMREDGRLKRFVESGGSRFARGTSLPPKPCSECGKLAKPLARGCCKGCYQRRNSQQMNEEERGRKNARARERYAVMKAGPPRFICTECEKPCWRVSGARLCDACDSRRRYWIQRRKELANPRPSRRPRGERIHNSRLTEQDVRAIRNMMAAGDATRKQLATQYGVDLTTIRAIVLGLSWAHVK